MEKAKLNHSLLSRKEYSRLVEGLLRDWQAVKLTLEDPVLTKLKTRLQESADMYRLAISEVKDPSIKEQLIQLDKLRDKQLTVLYELIKVARYATVSEEQNAYYALSPFVKNAMKMKHVNHEEESSYINGILIQFKKSEYQVHTRTLNLTKIITSLTKTQEDFDALLQRRNSVNATRVVYNLVELRKKLQDAYQCVYNYLFIMATTSDKVTYMKLYKVLLANQNAFKPLSTVRKNKAKSTTKTAKKKTTENTVTVESVDDKENVEIATEEKVESHIENESTVAA